MARMVDLSQKGNSMSTEIENKDDKPADAGSVRDELLAAFDVLEKGDAGVTEPAAPTTTTEKPDATPARPAQNRDEGGRFAPGHAETKDAAKPAVPAPTAAQPAVDPAAKPSASDAQNTDTRPLDPPARWTKEEKEAFAKLPPEAQTILANRNKALEGSYTKAMQEIAGERQKFAGIEEVVAPFREQWKRIGLDEKTAIKQVLETYNYAYTSPVEFIKWFANQRGIKIGERSADPGTPPAAGQPAPAAQSSTLPPEVQAEIKALRDEITNLRGGLGQTQQTLQQRQEAEQRAVWDQAARELQEFERAVDSHGQPKYPFYDEVKVDMSRLITIASQNNEDLSLSDAYDRAIYARPDIRQKLLDSREINIRREYDANAEAAARKARNASSSVTPSTVAAPGRASRPVNGSVRDELSAAWDALEG